MRANTAVAHVRTLAADTAFEPQEIAAPLLVIDPDTATGMHFDALWICGLDAARWPAPATPDPFLPRDWQARRCMPGATAEATEQAARRTLLRLSHAAPTAICSVPRFEDDAPLLPSALVAGLPRIDAAELVDQSWAGVDATRALFAARPALVTVRDGQLPAFAELAVVKGGTRLLELQAACPFRAAVELRLGGRELEDPAAGIAPTERGTLVHEVLEAFWRDVQDQRSLAALTRPSLVELLRRHVQGALVRLREGADDVRLRLLELEQAWLEARVLELVALDLVREPFTVVQTEAEQNVDVGGVQVRVKLDRVDRLADGTLAVIDYKTGSNAKPAAWMTERPESPQLPLYVRIVGQDEVGAVAFGVLRKGATEYVGIARNGAPFVGLKPFDAAKAPFKDYADWASLMREWQRRLDAIAREHAAGDARLAPNPAKACRYCHLPGLCRSARRFSKRRRPTMSPAELLRADALAREHALDVTRSFIVQAPAGSGKTELLTQRFLALLAVVERPEALLAITFTRKAAAEMRNRILEALRQCDDAAAKLRPETRALAQRVLAVDARLRWGLLRNPSRLRVLTIDSLNQSLARRLPVLSGLGAGLGIDEDGRKLYELAAERLLAHLPSDDPRVSEAVAVLLEHLDNNVDKLVALISGMLARREAWLPVLPADPEAYDEAGAARAALEANRAAILTDHLVKLVRAFPPLLLADLCRHARRAARVLEASGKESPIRQCADGVPGTDAIHVAHWQGLAEFLLTDKQGQVRKSFTAAVGVLPKDPRRPELATLKQQIEAAAAALAGEDEALALLAATRTLPPPAYEDGEWRVLRSLLLVLRLAAGELKAVFAERKAADYPEFAAAARQSLGTADEPTDTALALDARLRHVLVDEFQDTSEAQVQLLERLTAGWKPDDGRTLFLVGDPMQSIYRFRNAEVGLFLDVRDRGLGGAGARAADAARQFPLDPAARRVGQRVLHARAAAARRRAAGRGAVLRQRGERTCRRRRAACTCTRSCAAAGASRRRPVADIVERRLAESADATIAILVQGRSHLLDIVAELDAPGIDVPGHRHRSARRAPRGARPARTHARAGAPRRPRCLARRAARAVVRAAPRGLPAVLGDDRHATTLGLLQDPTRRARLGRGTARAPRALPARVRASAARTEALRPARHRRARLARARRPGDARWRARDSTRRGPTWMRWATSRRKRRGPASTSPASPRRCRSSMRRRDRARHARRTADDPQVQGPAVRHGDRAGPRARRPHRHAAAAALAQGAGAGRAAAGDRADRRDGRGRTTRCTHGSGGSSGRSCCRRSAACCTSPRRAPSARCTCSARAPWRWTTGPTSTRCGSPRASSALGLLWDDPRVHAAFAQRLADIGEIEGEAGAGIPRDPPAAPSAGRLGGARAAAPRRHRRPHAGARIDGGAGRIRLGDGDCAPRRHRRASRTAAPGARTGGPPTTAAIRRGAVAALRG